MSCTDPDGASIAGCGSSVSFPTASETASTTPIYLLHAQQRDRFMTLAGHCRQPTSADGTVRGQIRVPSIQTNTSMMLPSRPITGTTLAAAEEISLAKRATD